MKKYLYSENGIRFIEVSEREIVNLVLKDVLNPDSSIQDADTGQWHKIRQIDSIMKKVFEPDIKLRFSEPNIDNFLETGFDTIYYHISPLHFAFMMILSPYLFLLYWMYRNWEYSHRNHKGRRSIVSKLGDLFRIGSLFFGISRDKDLVQRAPANYDPDKLSWYVYGILFLTWGGLEFASNLYLKLSIELVASLLLIWVLHPINTQIRSANKQLGNPYSLQSVMYFVILLYGIFRLIFVPVMRLINSPF